MTAAVVISDSLFTGNYGADFGGAIYMESVGVELRNVVLDSNACAPVRGLGGGLASAPLIPSSATMVARMLCCRVRGRAAPTELVYLMHPSRAKSLSVSSCCAGAYSTANGHALPMPSAGVNAFLAASNVTAHGNAGGFTGGGMHLQNTQHLLPGVPLSGITVINNTCAFAGGFAVFGGALRTPFYEVG